jgi:hypothetical protein
LFPENLYTLQATINKRGKQHIAVQVRVKSHRLITKNEESKRKRRKGQKVANSGNEIKSDPE